MTQERTTILFFELFSGLPRQGPGDAASTLRALALVPGIGPESHVLDLGCGTGSKPVLETCNGWTSRPVRSTSSGARAPSRSWAWRPPSAIGAGCSSLGDTWP